VNYVITAPGKMGASAAFFTEVVIAYCMMIMVLVTSNHTRFFKFTGVFAGVFVAIYVIISGPISGFGMNPARSLASAIPSGMYPSFWIYIIAPLTGMFSAAYFYKLISGITICAKLQHSDIYKCIFYCGYCKNQQKSSEKQTKEDSSVLTKSINDSIS